MNLSRIASLVIIVLLLQGCGLKFWYNRIDWVVPWYIDDYVELSDGQEEQLERFLGKTLNWHRRSELPEYVELLQGVRKDLLSGDIIRTYDDHRVTIRGHYQTLLEQTSTEVVGLLSELTHEQVKDLIETLNEQDEERAESRAEQSEEERLERRTDNLIDSLGDWIGRLDKQQKQLVTQWVSEQRSTYSERMIYRAKWRAAFAEALVEPKPDQKNDQLYQLIVNGDSLQSQTLQAAYKHNGKVSERYLTAIYQSLSDKQRERLLRRLDDYIEDLEDLASQTDD